MPSAGLGGRDFPGSGFRQWFRQHVSVQRFGSRIHVATPFQTIAMAADGDDVGFVTLISFEGDVCKVERGVACMPALIKNMIRDCVGDERIPLPNVKTAILNKVVDYCKYHKNVPPKAINKLLTSNNLMECGVSASGSTFLHIEQVRA